MMQKEGDKEKKVLHLTASGKDLSLHKRIPPSMSKAAFILLNDNNDSDKIIIKQTDGRSVDAYHMMKLFIKYGFDTYFLHNPTTDNFLKNFSNFLEVTRGYFVFFYTGNGKTNKKNRETIVFKDGEVNERFLLKIINEKKCKSSIFLHISDSCYDKCILDLSKDYDNVPKPDNMISISCYNNEKYRSESTEIDPDSEEDQFICKHIEKGGNGVFAYHFWKTLTNNPKMTPNMLCASIKDDLKRHKQSISLTTTNPTLLEQNLFY